MDRDPCRNQQFFFQCCQYRYPDQSEYIRGICDRRIFHHSDFGILLRHRIQCLSAGGHDDRRTELRCEKLFADRPFLCDRSGAFSVRNTSSGIDPSDRRTLHSIFLHILARSDRMGNAAGTGHDVPVFHRNDHGCFLRLSERSRLSRSADSFRNGRRVLFPYLLGTCHSPAPPYPAVPSRMLSDFLDHGRPIQLHHALLHPEKNPPETESCGLIFRTSAKNGKNIPFPS